MFGARLDYWLLRPLARRPAEADGAVLSAGAEGDSLAAGAARLARFNARVGGRIPRDGRMRYMDAGCGRGEMTVALALESGGFVKAVDSNPEYVEAARSLARAASLGPARVQFECADCTDLARDGDAFDVVLSHEALEHYADPRSFLARARSMLRGPGSRLVLGFGPLFHSPVNVHVTDALKAPIPWCPLLFSEKALLRLRQERWRPHDPADAWEEIEGGLNRMRHGEFLRWTGQLGYATDFLDVNPQLRRWPPLRALSSALVRMPLVRDYFAASIYAVLRPGRSD